MYSANEKRYEKAEFNKCGESGLYLPKISLGLWQNFGDQADYDEMKDIILTAFDMGVTHFDLANNYGPKPGAAEVNFGKIVREILCRTVTNLLSAQRRDTECGTALTV